MTERAVLHPCCMRVQMHGSAWMNEQRTNELQWIDE
jgi:hypothetical protein